MSRSMMKVPRRFESILEQLQECPVVRVDVPVGRNPLCPVARPYRNKSSGTVMVREARFAVRKVLKNHVLIEILEG